MQGTDPGRLDEGDRGAGGGLANGVAQGPRERLGELLGRQPGRLREEKRSRIGGRAAAGLQEPEELGVEGELGPRTQEVAEGLAAALPNDWSINQIYFAITIIISLIGWTELARVVRGRFLSLRQEDFVMAAELCGCGRMRIIFTHLVPSFLSHIIAATTLAIPAMIISETSLSFLGLGIQPPAPSWGNMIREGVDVLINAPWISVYAGLGILVTILSFNMLGDGVRDMVDPRLRGE